MRCDWESRVCRRIPCVMRISLLFLSTTLAAAPVDFVRDVQPLFKEHCYSCHGPNKQEAALRLDHKPSAMKGGDFGTAILPGKSADSPLVHAIEGKKPKMRMPRKGDPLSAEQIALVRRWIDEGAAWPDSASVNLDKKVDHWAFKPPVKVKPPAAGNPIDAFIRARLEKEGLKPSPKASPEVLRRRLALDLVGLPPSPADSTERLLQSPHFGERWGRHWLDAAHYADSNGYEKDPMRFIWFYRDWVINAFNQDMPYNQVIIEQIAGAANTALRLPDLREKFLAAGAEPAGGTPEAFADYIRVEVPRWEKVIRQSGAKLD